MISFIQNQQIIYNITEENLITIENMKNNLGYTFVLFQKIPSDILNCIQNYPTYLQINNQLIPLIITYVQQGFFIQQENVYARLACFLFNQEKEELQMRLFFGIKYKNLPLKYISDNINLMYFNEKESSYSRRGSVYLDQECTISNAEIRDLLGDINDEIEYAFIALDDLSNIQIEYPGNIIDSIIFNTRMGDPSSNSLNQSIQRSIDINLKKIIPNLSAASTIEDIN